MNILFTNWEPAWNTSWQGAGWTMFFFLILGTLGALVGAAIRFLCNRSTPTIRYTVSLAVFAVLALLPVGIAVWLSQSRPTIAAIGNATPITIDLHQPHIAPSFWREPTTALPSQAFAEPSHQDDGAKVGQLLDRTIAYLPWLWIVGAPITFALLATGLVGSERLRRSCTPIALDTVIKTCSHLRKSLNITRKVSLALCDRIAQPILVGIIRPLILLPPSALTGWSPDQLEMVLLHELAHVRRWDNLVNLLQRLVESLLFFHPAIWMVSRQVRRDREQCCDAIVVAHTAEPQAYAELLVSIATSPPPLAGLALARHPLAGRIRHILHLEDEPMLVSRRTLGFFTLLAASIVAIVLWQPTKITFAKGEAATEDSESIEQEEFAATDDPPDNTSSNIAAFKPQKIGPGDTLLLQVIGEFPDAPIDDAYHVEPAGTLALGPTYGRVDVAGKTLLEAEKAVAKHLSRIIRDATVQITWASPKSNKTTLLYDGKTFEVWREMWETELKTENRTECINALAAFGRAGHGKEAAETILDVAGEYDPYGWEDNADGKFRESVLTLLSRRLPASSWLTSLMERYDSDAKKWEWLASSLLGRLYMIDEQTRQQLLSLANSDHDLRGDAVRALVRSDRNLQHPVTVAIARKALQGEHPDLGVLNELMYQHLDRVPEQFALLFHEDFDVRKSARGVLARNKPTQVFNKLFEVLNDPAQSKKHVYAIRALALKIATKQGRERIASHLQIIAREGDEQLLGPVLFALGKVMAASPDDIIGKLSDSDILEDRKKLLQDTKAIEELLRQEEKVWVQPGGGGRF